MQPVTPSTYEIVEFSDGSTVFKCLFCGTETNDPANVDRLYCEHCHWFHERLDEECAAYSRHLYTAVQEVRCALDLAEAAADDVERLACLRAALRELRKALSRL